MASSTSQRERITILLASRKGLSMKPGNKQFAAAAFSPAAPGAPAAKASGIEVLNEGFGNVGGTVDNWRITPALDLSGTTVLTFFTRHPATPGFKDMLELRFSSGAGLPGLRRNVHA